VATTTLTPARALRQPRHLDGRALLGLFFTVISIFGALLFWSAASETRAIVIATRDRPAGAQLTSDDLAIAHARVDDAVYRAAIPAAERAQLVGRQLAEPVHAQQVLVRAQVAGRAPLAAEQVAFTIPMNADTAAGIRLRQGDEVQVLVTLGKGTASTRTETVLERAAIYDVAYDERRGIGSPAAASGAGPGGEGVGRSWSGVPTTLTLAVTRAEAHRLANARWNGNLDVVQLPSEVAPRP
jgi:Flp pilus assembly protein CpaB